LAYSGIYKTQRTLLIVVLALAMITIGNIIYYKGLYNKQIEYVTTLLDRQAKISGSSIDNTDEGFIKDLHLIIHSDDLEHFTTDPVQRSNTIDKMKLFFSKYEDLITGMKLYDNKKNEFTLKKDETGTSWLEQIFVLHMQGEIIPGEVIISNGKYYDYYLPVSNNNELIGNVVVTVDFQRYFTGLFKAFSLKDYQWQWVLNDLGEIIYSNHGENLRYTHLPRISESLAAGESASIIHRAGGENIQPGEIISSYYATHLLQRNFGIIFSSPTDEIQQYIIRNSLLMGLGTLLLLTLVSLLILGHLRRHKAETERLRNSEKILENIMDSIPAGLVVYNQERNIIRANRIAAGYISGSRGKDITGESYPETSVTDEDNYYSRYQGLDFSSDNLFVFKRNSEECIILRSSVPLIYSGEKASMDMLVDVSMLENARKKESAGSKAKSDFIARMSYEIRTPLNGIIGMTDILEKKNLPAEAGMVVSLLKRSSEVLLNIINNILDFSKIETGKLFLDEVPFSLREEIVYSHDLARAFVDTSQVAVDCSVDDDVPDNVIGDPFRLRQILNNLLNHSVENTASGKISVRCSLKEKKEGLLILGFEISDTGKSYNQESLNRIFEGSSGSSAVAISADDETGFGTVLARQIISQAGGGFSAVSPSGLDEGKGTRINFTLNLHSNEKPHKDLDFDFIMKFRQVRALVITGSQNRDEELLGELHKLGIGFTVTTYQKTTARQIKAAMQDEEHRYHLVVITDDREFDGFEPLEELGSDGLTSAFRLIVISSNDRKGNLVKCNSRGVDHYLVKPFDTRELYEVIKECFPFIGSGIKESDKDKAMNDLRILVVEDNKMNQKVIGTMLKNLGCSCDLADDGFEGLMKAKTHKYDIIFMDLIMPEMDGFEASRKILEFDSSLMIVAFTADNLPESKRRAELSGIRDFISKPVRIDDLKKFFSRYFVRDLHL
jgi:signal transduction histidine kinase/CheY-like chemotaxis protein